MSFMWRPDTFVTDARVSAPAVTVSDAGERRLRAQVWSLLVIANIGAWAVGVWLAGAAIL